MEGFFELVYQVVEHIPVGKVATYGQIARILGFPRMARQVGYALHANNKPKIIPCHRVVNRFGKLADAFVFGGVHLQKEWLEEEGVKVDDNFCVDLSEYQWEA